MRLGNVRGTLWRAGLLVALALAASVAVGAAAAPAGAVDLNSASEAELVALNGVGPATAKKIIAGRPYLTKVDLVTKNVIPQGPYVSLKDQIVATQKGPPPKPKP